MGPKTDDGVVRLFPWQPLCRFLAVGLLGVLGGVVTIRSCAAVKLYGYDARVCELLKMRFWCLTFNGFSTVHVRRHDASHFPPCSHPSSMNSSGYLTVPDFPSRAFSVNSIAINASSGTSKGHFMFHFEALRNPNLG